jgi:hypothetical protein
MIPVEQLPAAVAQATAETVSPKQVQFYRTLCDWLAVARQCSEPACQRGRVCTGDPVQCFHRFYGGCVEAARFWVRAGIFSMAEGRTTREATRDADAELLAQLKMLMGLPLRRAERRRAEQCAWFAWRSVDENAIANGRDKPGHVDLQRRVHGKG